MSHTITLRATHDSYTDEGTPNRNFGGQVKIGVNGSGAGQLQRTYITFSLKALPKNAIVKEALLHTYLRGSTWAGANVLTARRITTAWSESKIKFSDAPTTTATNDATATVTAGSAGDEVEWDVTDMVADAVSGSAFHGIRITKDTSGDDFFHSSEQSNHNLRPKLVVTYAIPPAAPSNLRPRGDHSVNASKPKLAWDSDDVSAVWVQVDDDSAFGSLYYDSGWQAATEPFWDLALASAPSFTALTDNTGPWYWRVKVKSTDGDASNYSDSATFERNSYGTFSIDSPAVDGDAVDESTPTIITSLTGRTQTQIAWTVYRKGTTDTTFLQVQNQEPIATDDGTFELLQGAVTDPDADYRIVVKSWDTFDRETAVGEAAFTDDIRDFIYDPSAGTTVVAALAASQPTLNAPVVRVSWTRAAAPDSFDILVDSKVVTQHVDPGDVFVSGTSYHYDIYTSSPRSNHTYSVIATENHVDSISNPTVDFSSSVAGIWFIAPDDGILLPLWGKESVSASIGETGTTYELLNRPTPVRIVDAIRGLEGTVAGILDSVGDITVQESYDALISLKSLAVGANIRLCFGPKNIPVILGEVSVAPTPDPEERWEVSANFWQSGEFDVQ